MISYVQSIGNWKFQSTIMALRKPFSFLHLDDFVFQQNDVHYVHELKGHIARSSEVTIFFWNNLFFFKLSILNNASHI